ncbi:hypothetical protein QJS10_CPB17g01192 [Acorus calamus]|uniref:Uncharacterized protein n=1 Tax=Acorus calamus TaxID=4465 RepID=A0AAV9CSM2_ACOCL|nr:hypothetical protein QJS10_CPB17g01192 [Acorus calamus]
MRSKIVQDEMDGEDSPLSTTSLYCWWRSASESDDPPLSPPPSTGPSPRLKVVRELERLSLIAHESLDDLRHKLLCYRPGEFYLPTGGISRQDADVPPLLTILLVGLESSGKSSLINLMYSVLGRSGLIPFTQTRRNPSNRGTICLEEHNVLRSSRNGFCVFDSRGLDPHRTAEGIREVEEWMEDGVRHRKPCWRREDGEGEEDLEPSIWFGSSRFATRRVNSVMVVADVAEIYRSWKAGNCGPLDSVGELFHAHSVRKCNETPILILTHGDELTPDERIEGRIKICNHLGVSELMGCYDIPCLNEHGLLVEEVDPITAYSITEAVYRALLFGDRTHPPKRRPRDWVLYGLSVILCCFALVFEFLACVMGMLGNRKRKIKM